MGDLPRDLALVQIDGRDSSVGRLHQGQTVNIQPRVLARRALLRWLRRIRARVFTGPAHDLDFSARDAGNVSEVGNFLWRLNEADRFDAGIARVQVHHVRFGIVGTSGPVRSAGSRTHR